MDLNDFFLLDKDKKDINNWLKTFDKPLFISGKTGIGKTTFVNTILKDYTIVLIDHNLTSNISQYIQKTIHETDISMMFQMKKYKAILFDNIYYTDKTIIKILKEIVKKKLKTPYIIIAKNINNKQIKNIIQNCLHINISYTYDQYKFLLSKKYDNIAYITDNMIYKSDFNFHMINSNIQYFNNDIIINKDNIDSYEKDINILTNDFKNNYTLEELFIKYSCDYNTICLNIMDDIYKNDNIDDLCKLYECVCLYDNYEMFRSKNNLFNKDDLSIFFSICYPYTIIKNSTLKLSKNLSYNSYMSKSLIYTHLHGLYDSKLYYVYDLLIKCIYDIHKDSNKKYIVEIFNKYDCNIKIFNNYIKLSNKIYEKQISKNMIKEFNDLVK